MVIPTSIIQSTIPNGENKRKSQAIDLSPSLAPRPRNQTNNLLKTFKLVDYKLEKARQTLEIARDIAKNNIEKIAI